MDSRISFGSLADLPKNMDFVSYFSHLLKTKAYVDVTFILETSEGEIKFVAHQLVLAMRSSYFADMFYDNQGNKKHRIFRLKEINPKAFDEMIWYCYDVQPGLITIKETGALFQVANQFKVTSLMNVCRSRSKDFKVVHRNVFTLLEASEYMEDEGIKDICKTFIEEKTAEILNSYELPEITATMVHVIVSLPKLSFNSEYELIKWVFDWAKVKSQENDSGWKSVRDCLKSFLQDMNFLDLTFDEFATLCKDYPDCFDSDEIASIYMNIACPGCWKMPNWFHKKLKFREYTGWEMTNKHTNELIEKLQHDITDILAVEECCMEELAVLRSKCKEIEQNIKLFEKSKLNVECHKKSMQNSRNRPSKSNYENMKKIQAEELEHFRLIMELCGKNLKTFKMMTPLIEEFKEERDHLTFFYKLREGIEKECFIRIEKIKQTSKLYNESQESLRLLLESKLSKI